MLFGQQPVVKLEMTDFNENSIMEKVKVEQVRREPVFKIIQESGKKLNRSLDRSNIVSSTAEVVESN
jgi:hypothetical protein